MSRGSREHRKDDKQLPEEQAAEADGGFYGTVEGEVDGRGRDGNEERGDGSGEGSGRSERRCGRRGGRGRGRNERKGRGRDDERGGRSGEGIGGRGGGRGKGIGGRGGEGRGGRGGGRGKGAAGEGRGGRGGGRGNERGWGGHLGEEEGRPPERGRGGLTGGPNRRRGGRSNFIELKQKWNPATLGASDMHELASLREEEVVNRINSNGIKAFALAINDTKKISQRVFMEDVLDIVSKLAVSLTFQTPGIEATSHEEASIILAEMLSDRCPSFHMQLRRYIMVEAGPRKMQQLCDAFRILLGSLPECSWNRLPVEELRDAIERSGCGSEPLQIVQALKQSIREVVELKERITQQRLEKKKANYKAINEHCMIAWDNSEYRGLPLLPSWNEVCVNKTPAKLRPNIVDGAYEDWMHYYDVQFRLLREDFVAPLRRGICDYLDGLSGRKLRDIKVYNSVKIQKPVFTFSGVGYKVHFDTSRLQRCRWENSKRLLFGSLVCLSSDAFNNIVLFATVSDRKPKDLKDGYVSLQFEGVVNLQYILDPKAVFVMVESLAFFEASRHVLHSLQIAEVETMPFTRYIIKGECMSVNAPKYLDERKPKARPPKSRAEQERREMQMRSREEKQRMESLREECTKQDGPKQMPKTCYNLSCLYGSKERSKQPLVFNILNGQNWPDAKSVELDQSQLDAIRQALTQEIAVIQGPPGTGKTYIGLKIVETLLRNRKVWDPDRQSPILVMCYTNHALDQFLEGILNIQLPEDDDEDDDSDNSLFEVKDDDIDNSLSKILRNANIEPPSVIPKIVRVGGRCQNEAINEYNVEKLARKVYVPREILQAHYNCEGRIKGFRHASELEETENFFDPKKHKFLKLSELSALVDDPDHIYQLSQVARTKEEHGNELEIWLGLWNQVEITAKEDGEIIGEEIIDSVYPMVETQDAQTDMNLTANEDVVDACDDVSDTSDMENGNHQGKGDSHFDNAREVMESSSDEDVQGEIDIEESTRVLTEDIEDYQLVDFGIAKRHEFLTDLVNDEPHIEESISINDGNSTTEEATNGDILDDSDIQKTDSEALDNKYVTNRQKSPAAIHKKIVVWRRKTNANESVIKYLFKSTMSPAQAKTISNISAMKLQKRWQLYNYWVERKYKCMVDMNQDSFKEYSELCEEYKKTKQQAHRYVFETSDVIGLTTTGAAKYQHIIHMVKPRIVIVEEAAEVLESHIVSALSAGTQHLILIGDHKQLRPKPNEYELVRKYNLDISLFERLVHCRLPHAMLNIQHRMRPEISQLVHPHIYASLYNHESVLQYDKVKGVFKNMFFINHEYPEETEENLMSHVNDHEAKFIVALCKYLLQQGYDKSQITILTPYTGQLLKLKGLLPKATCIGIRATSVDNFQGEENDIILLSLVRSNAEAMLGFLKEENRVCVALSRAKKGFYCIGNFKMLRANAPIWEQIMSDMESKGYVDNGIQLQCQIHTKSTFIARLPKDFDKYAAEGGCTLPCEYRLQCGHKCTKMCHMQDQKHENYKCSQPCARCCSRGHSCDKDCFQPCGECNVHVEKVIPICKHVSTLPCHQDPASYLCKAPCLKCCERGHPCKKVCHETCKCDILVMKEVPTCKHSVEMPCHMDPSMFKCNIILHVLCKNEMHKLEKLCGSLKQACSILVEKSIKTCGHTQLMPCDQDPGTFSCLAPCEKWMSCCLHKCPKLCGKPCQRLCNAKVEKILMCGHTTKIACHLLHDMTIQCPQKCAKTLPCGHPCNKMCNVPCTPCNRKVNKLLPCGHKVNLLCYQSETPGLSLCKMELIVKLDCGHNASVKCCESNNVIECKRIVLCTYPCKHTTKAPCHLNVHPSNCKEKCQTILLCGHQCSGNCGECYERRMHQLCPFDVKLNRLCGHTISTRCKGLYDSCSMKYTFSCPHVTVNLNCPEPFPLCTERCSWACPHYICTKLCHELCNRPHCNKRCGKVLKCGHQCFGVCGESCLTLCLECNEKEFKQHLRGLNLGKKGKVPRHVLYVQQKLCGHIHTVEYMDSYVDSKKSTLVRPIQCPENSCQSGRIEVGFRYGNAQKMLLKDVRQVAVYQKERETEFTDTILDEKYSTSPTIMVHNASIVQNIKSLLDLELVGKDEASMVHLLMQASNVIEYIEKMEISVHVQQFAQMCLNFFELSSAKNSLKCQLSEQLVVDFLSELYQIMLRTHCIEAKRHCISESVRNLHITPVEDILDTLEIKHNERMSEADYKQHRASLQVICPMDGVVTHSKVFIARCHWLKCGRCHGYYSVAPKFTNAACPQCMVRAI